MWAPPERQLNKVLRMDSASPVEAEQETTAAGEALQEGVLGSSAATAGEGEEQRQALPQPSNGVSADSTRKEAVLILAAAPPGRKFILISAARTVVGKAVPEGEGCSVADPELEDRHFVVDCLGDEYFVRDLGTTAGTRLNGQRIRATQLLPGDVVQAGKTLLLFQLRPVG